MEQIQCAMFVQFLSIFFDVFSVLKQKSSGMSTTELTQLFIDYLLHTI